MSRKPSMSSVTAIIKTFMRDDYLKTCIRSLLECYPSINIALADDGYRDISDISDDKAEMYDALKEAGHFTSFLPFDSGLCVGRNRLVNQAKTKYVLIGDDDFRYSLTAGVDRMVKFLDEHPEVDLIGGRVLENGKIRNYQGNFELTPGHYVYHPLDIMNDLEVEPDGFRWKQCDLTFNFFVARTEAVKEVLWDEQIKVAYEHSDFFIGMKNVNKKVVFTPDCIVEHKPVGVCRVTKEYRTYRSRKSDKRRFFTKYGLEACTDMRGRLDTMNDAPGSGISVNAVCFERPEAVKRLVLSIAEHQPQMKVRLADNSRRFIVSFYKNLWMEAMAAGLKQRPKALNASFDKGLSFCRNLLITESDSDFLFFCDDDIQFTDQTKIAKLAEILEQFPEVGIVGGSLASPEGQQFEFDGFIEHIGDRLTLQKPIDPVCKRGTSGGIKFGMRDFIPNFFLARREVFDDVRWDPEIKIWGEHAEFFMRLKENTDWRVAYCPEVSALHVEASYGEFKPMKQRNEFLKLMMKKHELRQYDVFSKQYIFNHETDTLSSQRSQ